MLVEKDRGPVWPKDMSLIFTGSTSYGTIHGMCILGRGPDDSTNAEDMFDLCIYGGSLYEGQTYFDFNNTRTSHPATFQWAMRLVWK